MPGKALSQEMFGLLLDGAQTKHYKRKIGLPEAYQPGIPYPPQSYDINHRRLLRGHERKVQSNDGGRTSPFLNGCERERLNFLLITTMYLQLHLSISEYD